MARRRRKSRHKRWARWALFAVGAVPALYLLAALAGSLIPVNRGWVEPGEGEPGVTVYIADNGIHADIIMPAVAQGLDWRPLVPRQHVAAAHPDAQWVSFGSGEERVYLETPRWQDIKLKTIWSGVMG